MKDIVIKGKFIRRELFVLLACFVVAFIMNVVAVFVYDRPLVEIVSQIGYVVVITACIYALLAVLRGIVALLARVFIRK